jgi:hypothetical protein
MIPRISDLVHKHFVLRKQENHLIPYRSICLLILLLLLLSSQQRRRVNITQFSIDHPFDHIKVR